VLFPKSRASAFTDTTNGYCDWKYLNPNILVHENIIAHRQCYIQMHNGKDWKIALKKEKQ
jgi:hypothetical protein